MKSSVERSNEAAKLPQDLELTIVPGFVNFNECLSFLPAVERSRFQQSMDKSDHFLSQSINAHLMVNLVLAECERRHIESPVSALAVPKDGAYFAGLVATKGVGLKKERVRNQILRPQSSRKLYLEFGKEHFVNNTGMNDQTHHNELTIVGKVRHVDGETVIIQPLIMGHGSFDVPPEKKTSDLDWLWLVRAGSMQVFPGDVEQFSKINNKRRPSVDKWQGYMRSLSEKEVKEKFAKLLGVVPDKDWGGEDSDLFTGALQIGTMRMNAAFCFKGPGGGFRKMQISHLGKNGDQLIRMCRLPVQVVVLQHCHEFTPNLVDFLMRCAVFPPTPKRFCLIDGTDTYRIFSAYGLVK